MNFDLHCHSTASDGTLAPRALARRAAANGVDLWALTDHDVLAGLDEARDAAQSLGMHFVDGVEISVTWRGQTIHIVGLGIDPRDPGLVAGLARTRANRQARAGRIAAKLEAAGIPDALAGAYRFADEPELVSRTHFARYLVSIGRAADVGSVFDRYLAPGKTGYVPHEWARLGDAVGWIRGAGGHAVIAHPGRYDVSRTVLEALIGEFKAAGGVGIEVITGSHSPDQYAEFTLIARRHGLLASCGSDFHGPEDARIDLGALPRLAAGAASIVEAVALFQA